MTGEDANLLIAKGVVSGTWTIIGDRIKMILKKIDEQIRNDVKWKIDRTDTFTIVDTDDKSMTVKLPNKTVKKWIREEDENPEAKKGIKKKS